MVSSFCESRGRASVYLFVSKTLQNTTKANLLKLDEELEHEERNNSFNFGARIIFHSGDVFMPFLKQAQFPESFNSVNAESELHF